jgi:hypothetical protein
VTLTAIDHAGTKTGTSTGFTVNPGPLDHFAVSNPGTVTAGTAFTTTTITAQDANNNTVPSFIGTVDLTETGAGAGGTVSPSTSGTFTLGVLANPSLTLTKAAPSGVTLTATDHAGTGKTGTSTGFTVNSGPLDHFVVSNPGTVTAGTAFTTTTITAQDFYNNTVLSFIGTVDLTETGAGSGGTVSPSRSGTFTLGVLANPSLTLTKAAPSGVTLTATDHAGTGKTGTSTGFTVNPTTIDHYAVSLSGSPYYQGIPFTTTVTAQDLYNNTVTTDSTTVVANTSSSVNLMWGTRPNRAFTTTAWRPVKRFTPGGRSAAGSPASRPRTWWWKRA